MRRLLTLLILLCAAGAAQALEFRSVSEGAAMYDAPSQKAKPLYVIARGTPVEAVVTLDVWVKVRDQKGDLAWIEKKFLSDKRTVIVSVARAQIRQEPNEKSALVFEAVKEVVLELVEPAKLGWAKVRHRDGQSGFIKVQQAWGL